MPRAASTGRHVDGGVGWVAGAPLGPSACSEPQGTNRFQAPSRKAREERYRRFFRHDAPVRRPESNRAAGSLNRYVTTRLGLQIPNFSYGTSVTELFPAVRAQAQEAEAAGFDTVLVMDHFYQLPTLGEPDEPMLEAYTALGALASVTEKIQLSTLVTGNTYRNPTLLAKAVTTLDVVSGGRAILGIGAGWFELEHRQLGFEFGTFTERFAKLEEALRSSSR